MNICFDCFIFSNQKYGGISVHFASIIKELIKRDYKIFLLVTKKEYKKLLDNIHLQELIERINFVFIRNQFFVGFSVFQRNKIEIIHLTYYPFRFFDNRNIPIVSTFHDVIPEIYFLKGNFKYFFLIFFKFYNFLISDGICFVSNYSFDRFSEFYFLLKLFRNQKYCKTYNSYNLDLPSKVDKFSLNKYKKKHSHLFLYVGKRGGYKNFNKIIKSIKQVKFELSNSNFDPFIVILSGGELSAYEKKELGTLSYLKIENINSKDYAFILSKVDCLIHPSLIEGFGITILEALVSNCDVIAYKSKAAFEIAQNSIYYFEENNIKSINNALIKYIKNIDKLNQKKDFLKKITKRYSWSNSADNLVKFYGTLAKIN